MQWQTKEGAKAIDNADERGWAVTAGLVARHLAPHLPGGGKRPALPFAAEVVPAGHGC